MAQQLNEIPRDDRRCGMCKLRATIECKYGDLIPVRVPSDTDARNCKRFAPHDNIKPNSVSAVDLPSRYFNDAHFVPKLLTDELLEKYSFVTFSDNRQIHIYQNGVYAPYGEDVIKNDCRKSLGEKDSSHRVLEVVERIKDLTIVQRSTFDNDVNLSCLNNGIYDLTTGELEPFNPDLHFLQKHPITFDPDAQCPAIEKFLKEVLSKDEDREAVIELFGYCLYRSHKIQKAFMLEGGGNNGKSVLLSLLKTFLGTENTVSISLQNLSQNHFALANLHGRNANIYPDLPSKSLEDTSVFKGCTGEDNQTGEFKFGRCFNFLNYAKFIFSTNKIPISYDESDAFYRRWIIISFTQKFEDEKADLDLLSKLTVESEISGLFNLAIRGLKTLLARGRFINSRPTEETRRIYVRKSDPIATFCEDLVTIDPLGMVPKGEIYTKFENWCKKLGYSVVPYGIFHKVLPKKLPSISSYQPHNGQRCWKGILVGEVKDAHQQVLDKH
ncbi:phage/plasmid primase, P4 family [Candidatus Bathyarchaeota archaeon]|nr:phage/plasmid primase, P4 family [Candidatus Bathyarchaeota archaeon]